MIAIDYQLTINSLSNNCARVNRYYVGAWGTGRPTHEAKADLMMLIPLRARMRSSY